MVLFARESLRDPNLALTFAHDLEAEINWPKQYERAKSSLFKHTSLVSKVLLMVACFNFK
jgi:hypothetical protein